MNDEAKNNENYGVGNCSCIELKAQEIVYNHKQNRQCYSETWADCMLHDSIKTALTAANEELIKEILYKVTNLILNVNKK